MRRVKIRPQFPPALDAGCREPHSVTALPAIDYVHRQLHPAAAVWLQELRALHAVSWGQVEQEDVGFLVAEPRLVDPAQAPQGWADQPGGVGRDDR